MSHELRTPLNAIIGYTELVLEDVDEDEVATDLQRILAAGRHLLALVDDVLDISRIEAGRLELIVSEAPLSDVIEEVLTVVRPEVHATGARFEVALAPDLGFATTDHRRLWQVCTNLLNNAIQHSRGRTVTFEVVPDGAHVAVEVRDDGVGIPPDRIARLFTPFVAPDDASALAESAPRSRRVGIGLGLSIARRLAEQLGGELSVVSAMGSGTTFRFTFLRHLELGRDE